MATPRICSVDGCDKPHYAKGYCALHWRRCHIHGDPHTVKIQEAGRCTIPGCAERNWARGLCNKHYQRLKKHGDPLVCRVPQKHCSIPGCKRPHRLKGWCATHYARWRRTGDANVVRVVENKRLQFVKETAAHYVGDDCFIWPFAKSSRGYGPLTIRGRQTSAHVLVCELVHGPKPGPEYEVAHNCGVRACCNPRHIRWATRRENHADKLLHGTAQRGEKHPRVKLTEEQVKEIRSLAGQLAHKQIAERYRITSGTVSNIINRHTWSWLE